MPPAFPNPQPTISVVIPTLNEAANLPSAVESVGPGVEVVVGDCGSTDGTRDVAAALGLRVVCGGRSRAEACNRGAAAANGDALLFLHGDTRLPDGWHAKVTRALATPGVVGGAFDFSFAFHPRARGMTRQKLRLTKLLNRVRFRWHRAFYGDQAIFCHRWAFESVGGFPRRPLMEDAHFSRAMGRLGRTAIVSPGVKTSPRRFVERGVLRQTAADMALMFLDACSVDPRRMHAAYNRLNREGHRCDNPVGPALPASATPRVPASEAGSAGPTAEATAPAGG